MAQKFSASLAAEVAGRTFGLYNFVEIDVATPIYLTDYHADYDLDGDTYTSSVLKSVEQPARTGGLSQEVQKLAVIEALNGYTSTDFISQLGDYYGAAVYMRVLCEGSTGLFTTQADWLWHTRGYLKKAYRRKDAVVLEIISGSEQLSLKRELRTTKGSIDRFSKTDTCFNRAASVNDTITLEWG